MRLFSILLLSLVLCYANNMSAQSPKAETSISTTQALKRAKPKKKFQKAFENYIKATQEEKINLHSVMVLKNGKVVAEQWLGDGHPDTPHILNSVSKTFTSTAVGLAISEGYFTLDTPVISFFPDDLPNSPSENLKGMTVRHLLTMTCGHDTEPSKVFRSKDNWIREFLAHPVTHKPGTFFCYNSIGTYMLSAIVQKTTGQKLTDYLTPRLFEPLGIQKPHWDVCPQGICTGGWGLYLKTEDLAKMGQLLLQKGKWNNKQILPKQWVEEASKKQVECTPAGTRPEQLKQRGLTPENSDWVQGYGYQMWRCRHNAFRADGAGGQYIVVLPEVNAVVVNTAMLNDMQSELNLIWKHLLPALK